MSFRTPTPLFAAASIGDTENVAAIIASGANVNQSCTRDTTPLFVASRGGHDVVVRALLNAGAAIDQEADDGSTALCVASSSGHVEIVSLLLAAGAAANHALADEDSDGITSLILASSAGHLPVVSALIAADADVNQREEQNGTTALHFASEAGHAEIADALIAAGACVNQVVLESGATPLYLASCKGHVRVLSALLEADAAVDQTTYDGKTPLLIAALEGHLPCVRELSSYSANRTTPSYQWLYDWFAAPDISILMTGRADLTMVLRCYADRRAHERDRRTNERRAKHLEVARWLEATALWCTPLHHLGTIGAARARRLLREHVSVHEKATSAPGVSLHEKRQRTHQLSRMSPQDFAAAMQVIPTPLSLAEDLRAAGEAPDGSAAALVLKASAPWSPSNHELFPAVHRKQARQLLLLGHQVSRLPCFEASNTSAGLVDVWIATVMPLLVERSGGPLVQKWDDINHERVVLSVVW